MMRIIRKLFLLLLVVGLVWGVTHAYIQITDGFSVRQMTSSLPLMSEYTVSLTPQKEAKLRKILSQSYHYIGKGCQCYAFMSDDGQYIIKFLKHKHLRPYSWLNKVPMPATLRQISDAKIARRQARVERLFSSCKLAYEQMADETGLIYVHLDRRPSLSMYVPIYDNIGLKHSIFVDNHEFIVQKRALLVKDVFERESQPEQIKVRIQQLADLILARCNKGIADKDRSFAQNVAFKPDGSGAVFIDTGQFYQDEASKTKEAQLADLEKRFNDLYHWTKCHFPEHLPLVEAQIDTILTHF